MRSSSQDYPKNSSHLSYKKCMKEQKILKILKVDCKETIDFIFNEVGNPDLIKDGYVRYLSQDMQEYFYSLKNKG